MPIYNNALTQRPANRLAYQESIGPVPRNEYLGALADFLAQSYAPERTQQMQGAAQFLSVPAISQTLDRLSYGEPLTTGAGGLGGTTRVRPEALEAAMAVAPLGKPVTMATLQAARAARQAAMKAGVAGERYAERVVPQIMERGGLPAEMLNALANRTVSPLDVYHGTPHRFAPTERNPLGEFDASKIGTGEGAQAYGHGIYMAESPDVARIYSADRAYVGASMQGKPLAVNYDDPAWIAQKTIDELGDPAKAKSHLEMVQRTAGKYQPPETKAAVQGAIDLISSGSVAPKGSLYKVDLPDAKIATMLDWDAPLSKQPKNVQRWLKDTYNPYKSQLTAKDVGGNEPTGSLIYNRLQELMSEGKKSDAFANQASFGAVNASKELSDFGISGIKYFDESSRAAGKGTRNFVVFPGEEKSMTILERNKQKR